MADLKSTATSDYPTSLDTFTTIVDADTRAAVTVNGLADALVKIETALGTNPQGTKQDVKTNLQIGHTTAGVHRQGLADSTSGSITGTTSETDLVYVEVPANTLKTTEMIRVTALISIAWGAATTLTFRSRIRFGDYTTILSGTSIYFISSLSPIGGGTEDEDLNLTIWLFAQNSLTSQKSMVEHIYREVPSDGSTNVMQGMRMCQHYNLSEDCSQIRRLYINMKPDDTNITITLKRMNAELFGV